LDVRAAWQVKAEITMEIAKDAHSEHSNQTISQETHFKK
jgi:hypothetical protein